VPGAISPGLKRQGREANHSPPTSAKVKNVEQYLHNQISLHEMVLNKLNTGIILLLMNLRVLLNEEYFLIREENIRLSSRILLHAVSWKTKENHWDRNRRARILRRS
jgi:hypothetical protein